MRFRLSTLFATIATVAALLTMWITYSRQDSSIKLVSQSGPVLTYSARSDRQAYRFSQLGETHTLHSTFSENYPSQIWPRIKWSFKLSNGHGFEPWQCDDLVLYWDRAKLLLDDGIQSGKPFVVKDYGDFRIVKYWWPSRQATTSISQEVHLYLIENGTDRILSEHRMTVVVDVSVPVTASFEKSQ